MATKATKARKARAKSPVKQGSHDAVFVPVKMARIDRKILSVIAWFNSHPGVFTRHCCEGDHVEPDGFAGPVEEWAKPYIVWHCDDPLTLCTVLRWIAPFGDTHVQFYELSGGLRYTTRFHSQERMLEMAADIEADRI